MQLICFPYAGATSAVFFKWKKYLNGIKILAADLPGRGRRMAEPLCITIEEMVSDLKKQVTAAINSEEEYAVYGHSMGGLLVYELLHELLRTGFPMPVHVFLSGKNPPDINVELPIHQLKEDEFIKKIGEMGGMDTQFFENPLLAKLYLPILRTDLSIVETYHYKNQKQPLPVNISYFLSSHDAWAAPQQVKHWSDFATGSFQMYHFKGGHFFIFEQEEKITEIIRETLSDAHAPIPY